MDETPRISELRKKLEKDPGSRLFAQLAEELRKEGRHDDAITVARTGLAKNPNYPSARLTLARALLDSGRPGEARPELEQVVRAAADNILASRLLGEALEDLGQEAEALRQFEHTLRLSPGDKALGAKIAELKAKMSSARPPVAAPVQAPPAAAGPVLGAPLPSVLPEVGLPSVPDVVTSAELPAAVPAASVALDRDLASGTFSPGSLTASDLQKHFDEVDQASPEVPERSKMDETLGFAEMDGRSAPLDTADTVSLSGASPLLAEVETPGAGVQVPISALPVLPLPVSPTMDELPSAEAPPQDAEVGATTLPLNSVTLADLYLQQGLKAEASAVLSQVIKEEPENLEARSRFAAVSGDLAQDQAEPAEPVAEPTPWTSLPPVTAASDLPSVPELSPTTAVAPRPRSPFEERPQAEARPRSRAEVDDQSIAVLKAFLSAVEREAIQQRATERGAF
jgi:tetratricopeptide (TPR) repeat protein